ncbi:MAG: efflux RND transporter periplasmic adaptor subunit [Woeseia sp.]
MKRSTFFLAASAASVIVVGGSIGLFLSDGSNDASVATESDMPRYRVDELEVGVTTDPATPRVGDNRLIVEIRKANGEPVTGVSIDAYAEMSAMGAMPAMRVPAEMDEAAPGRYVGSMNFPMRGEWPLTLSFQSPEGRPVRMQFDLATDRANMPIAAGGTPIGGVEGPSPVAALPADDTNIITIDNRRRQMIGVETGEATLRNLVKPIRAVGEITFDERLLSHVTLKFDGYIGDLKADYVGTPVEKGQVLFTVYGPDLLAAQQEYLETLKRRGNRSVDEPLIRAARQRLALWDMSVEEIKALEQRGEPQDYVPIYAPRRGTLIERNIADGSAARMGQTLLTIADLSRVWVEAEVFEADLEQVSTGMPATVALPYLPGREYPATVEYVYPYLEGDSRTARIRLSLDNPDGELKPAMYAEVSLKAELGLRLSVPEEAIIFAGESRVVFVDLGGGRLKPVRIITGRNAQGFVEVLGGLAPGDAVVTSGNFLIAAETRLKSGIDQW